MQDFHSPSARLDSLCSSGKSAAVDYVCKHSECIIICYSLVVGVNAALASVEPADGTGLKHEVLRNVCFVLNT
jgi:hypothetical protein